MGAGLGDRNGDRFPVTIHHHAGISPQLQAALAAAARGFAVFPLRPNDKRPAIKYWEQRATTNAIQIKRWWFAHRADRNIGLAAGRSGLVVIDLDGGRGDIPPPPWEGCANGREVLARLAHNLGHPFPGHTYTVRTPRGIHLYFQAPVKGPTLTNTTERLGFRVDSRAVGGYVVAPGSLVVRPGSLGPEGEYLVANKLPIAPLPEWLAQRLAPPPPPVTDPPSTATPDAAATPARRAERYLAAIISGETGRVRDARTGHRHRTLLNASITLGTLVGGGELAEARARDALLAAAQHYVGVDDYTAEQVHRDIKDGLAYGTARPRQL
jgi:hypothetical protein